MTAHTAAAARASQRGGGAHRRQISLAGRSSALVLGIVIIAAAVVSGVSLGGDDERLVVLPIVGVAGVVLAVLAATRFTAFVLLVLGARASIDLFKLSGPSSGNTLTNTAAVRGLDPSSLLAMLFLLAATIWLVAQYASGRRFPGSPLRLGLLTFVAAGAVSAISAVSPQASMLEVLRILSVAMMFVILEQLITNRALMIKTIAVAYGGLLFPLIYTLVTLLAGQPDSEVKGSFTRLTGPFAQSNTFARYLGFMIVFGIAFYPYLSRRLRLAMVPVLGLSSVFLALTLTRSSIITTVVGVLIVAFIQRRKAVLLGFAVSAMLAAILVPGLSARFATLTAPEQQLGQAETGNSLQWRLNYWTRVLPLANDSPVTGIGLNMTQYQTSAAKQPHNDFIRAYVETGVFGLLTYLSIHFLLLRNAVWALFRSARGTLEHGVASGALGCAVSFLLGSLVSNMMSNVVSLWYLIAFSAAASYVARRDPRTGFIPGLYRERAVPTQSAQPSDSSSLQP
jgi:O-antigen ligase